MELLASSVIFLLLLATLHGAVRFSSSSLQKAEAIRQNAAELRKSVRTAPAAGDTKAEYTFQAVSADGSAQGGDVLFKVPVKLLTKTAAGTNGEVVFYVFGSSQEAGP